ncbi:MAG: TfoX/Sxy family protein [Tissierellia bacterium]|nr:TfoX/Sxy family protein [Tissierellia bacterium]
MSKLSELKNIGVEIERKLNEVGIITQEELFELGSKEAFTRIRSVDKDACIQMLYALEGSIRDIRHHSLDGDIKSELRAFYDDLNR